MSAPHRHTVSASQRVGSPRGIRYFAMLMLLLLVLAAVAMLALPWQQTATGSGRVVAFAPTERQQTVEAPVKGRIANWNDKVYEGALVKKGTVVCEVVDNDEEYFQRLAQKNDFAQQKLASAKDKEKAYSDQINSYREYKIQTVEMANRLVTAAERDVEAAEQDLTAAEAAMNQEKADFQRQAELYRIGIASQLKYQTQQRKAQESIAKYEAAKAKLESTKEKLESKRAEREQKAQEAQAKIEYALALHQAAVGEVAIARKELTDSEVALSRQQQQQVIAPKDGLIYRLHANPNAEQVKEGDPLFTIVPDTTDRAVELFITGNDIPLVYPGRHVRLQFEGWPAVQIGGWPSVAVGTFGGRVKAVDPTDNGMGQFRVLVVPEGEDNQEEGWPEPMYLRQGVRANGWVLLNEVSLGYEIWRQLNGFPSFSPTPPKLGKDAGKSESKDGGGKKEPKMPKIPK